MSEDLYKKMNNKLRKELYESLGDGNKISYSLGDIFYLILGCTFLIASLIIVGVSCLMYQLSTSLIQQGLSLFGIVLGLVFFVFYWVTFNICNKRGDKFLRKYGKNEKN